MSDIMVSIICNTYNHGDFIGDALEGFINQITNFDFEILVHDDASSDNTAKIIKEYEKKYPNLFKVIYQNENKYSQGIDIVKTYQLPRAKGKYIAFCEGDDYWIDNNKLQKQFDFLEENLGYGICAHCAELVRTNKKIIKTIEPQSNRGIISLERVILGGGGFVATSSIMIKREIMLLEDPMSSIINIDYVTQIKGSIPNGMLYLPDCMSAYRYMVPGSFTRRMNSNTAKLIEHNQKVDKMLVALDEYTNHCYSDTIQHKRLINQLHYLELVEEYREIFDKKYRKIRKSKGMIYDLRIIKKWLKKSLSNKFGSKAK